MKQKQKSEATREKVLECAETLFAIKGFDGTSIRQIVAEAGISIQTLHYHFESKLKLYYTVLERAILPLMGIINQHVENMLEQNLNEDAVLKETLEDIIDDVFDVFHQQPNYPLLFFRQWLERDREMMRVEMEQLMPTLHRWAIIAENMPRQKNGLDFRLLLVNLSWIYTGLFVNSGFLSDLIKMDKDSPAYIDHLKQHAKHLTMRLLDRPDKKGPVMK